MAPKSRVKGEYEGEANEKGLDISGLHQTWDGDQAIRHRLRNGLAIIHEKSGLAADNNVCKLNRPVLDPDFQELCLALDPGLQDEEVDEDVYADAPVTPVPKLKHKPSFTPTPPPSEPAIEKATEPKDAPASEDFTDSNEEVGKPILTKRDQFRLKSGIKSGPKRGRKGHRGNGAAGKATGPSKRRRRVLRASSRRSLGDEAENDDELVEEASTKPSPKAKAKALAKSKASPKAKSKAKAKAKAKASPKAKSKAKAKASPKASTGADDTTSAKEKTTKRGRRAPPPEDSSVMSLEDGLWWYLSAESEDDLKQQLLPLMHKYHDKKLCPEFKKERKAATTESEHFTFTMYWTRPAVGVQHKESGIEIGQISTGPKAKGSWATKMVAVTDGAAMLGYVLEGLLGDGYIENVPEAMTQSYDIYRMKEFIKAAVHSALEEFAAEPFMPLVSRSILWKVWLDGYRGDYTRWDEASWSDVKDAGLCREAEQPVVESKDADDEMEEKFFARMHVVVTRKNSVKLLVEEQLIKITGAIKDCEARASTHIRRNTYDNELEYWVNINKSGTRKTSASYEEKHKQEKDVTDPKEMPDVGSLQDLSKIENHAAGAGKSPKKAAQENLVKIMDSIMAQISKLRTVSTLEHHIKSLESNFDHCQEAKLKSEMNAKKYYEKLEEAKPKAAPKAVPKASQKPPEETEKPRSSAGHLVRTLSQEDVLPFPWATASSRSVSGQENNTAQDLGKDIETAADSDTASVASSGIKSIGSTNGQASDDRIKYDLPAPGSVAGKVLLHAIRVMEKLFRKQEPLIWKVGFTHNPSWRWANELYGYVHARDKWAGMIVLYFSTEQFGPAMLEVPCTRAIKTARAVVKDLGEEKAGEIGLQPDHPIFGMARNNEIDLSRTAAVVMHGDEGRGRRRQAFMVLSFHSLLGRGTNFANKKSVKKSYLKMRLNFKGHSYCSRLLSGVLPKHMYQKDDEVFETLLRASCEDARTMMTEGVLDADGNRFWMACLGTVGDWPFLHKSGHFTRTFANVVKRVDQVAGGICHLCDCGPDSLPFERFATRRPDWLATLNATSPFQTMPAAARIPHAPGQPAATFYFDLFHCWHLGVGRNFVGSALVLLSDLHAGNIDERFDQLTIQYKDWCRRNGASPILTRIHKDNIQWASTSEFPTGTWFKGEVTTNMVRFFEDCDGLCDEPIFRLAIQAAQAINEFLRLLYSSDLWLPPEVARRAAELMFRFLRRYESCARLSYEEGRTLFILQPKLHTLQHCGITLLHTAGRNMEGLNPLCWSTQMSEDF
ncbi:unnamed protein product, partial [Symbiodinium sp. KB8]